MRRDGWLLAAVVVAGGVAAGLVWVVGRTVERTVLAVVEGGKPVWGVGNAVQEAPVAAADFGSEEWLAGTGLQGVWEGLDPSDWPDGSAPIPGVPLPIPGPDLAGEEMSFETDGTELA